VEMIGLYKGYAYEHPSIKILKYSFWTSDT